MTNNFKDTQDIWVNNIYELFNKKYILQFFPSKNNNVRENINSIMRLSLYVSIVLTILYRNISYMIILAITALVTYIYYLCNKNEITEHMLTDMLHKKLFVRAVESKPYNPLQHKLVGEKSTPYEDAYLVSDNREITDNMLYEYNKIYSKVEKEIPEDDTLNEKETMLNLYPLADKTGIPNFIKFAKNVYGTTLEDRKELVKRGYISKADNARLNKKFEPIDFDPANITNIQ